MVRFRGRSDRTRATRMVRAQFDSPCRLTAIGRCAIRAKEPLWSTRASQPKWRIERRVLGPKVEKDRDARGTADTGLLGADLDPMRWIVGESEDAVGVRLHQLLLLA